MPSVERNVIAELSKLSVIVEVNSIWGEFDIFVKVVGTVPNDIDSAISKIRSIKGITNTYTMTVLYGQGGTIDEEPNNGV